MNAGRSGTSGNQKPRPWQHLCRALPNCHSEGGVSIDGIIRTISPKHADVTYVLSQVIYAGFYKLLSVSTKYLECVLLDPKQDRSHLQLKLPQLSAAVHVQTTLYSDCLVVVS